MRPALRISVATFAALLGLLPVAGFAQQSTPLPQGHALSAAQRAEVIALIRQELVQDPSILRDAIASLQAADQASQASAASKAITANQTALFANPGDPILGNAQAPISVVEFYDTRCPYCRAMRPEFAELVRRNPNVRVIFKDIPILGANSTVEAQALLAAQKQGHYIGLQTSLMSESVPPTDAHLRALATQLGMNGDELLRDMHDPAISARLKANLDLAQTLGVTGTPAIVVGDQLVPGAVSLDDLQKLVGQSAG